MDNALVADGVIVLLLIAGALLGAKRGLIKSLMGVFVIVGALLGAQMLSNVLTDPLTDIAAARIEDKLMQSVSGLRAQDDGAESAQDEGTESARDRLDELFERYGLPGELLGAAEEALNEAIAPAKEHAAAHLRETLASGVRAAIRGTVHTALALVCFLLLLIVLTLLAKVLDRVFDLPLLDATNAVGGAILGVLEAGAAICVLLFFARRFGVTALEELGDRGVLLPWFMLRRSLG